MKRVILLLVIVVCSQRIMAQLQSNCNVPNVLRSNYDSDVKHLALKRVYDLGTTYKDSIKIPVKFQDTIWNGLAAIFNLTSLKERDSVFDNYCIHNQFSDYIYTDVYVHLDANYSWTQNWKTLNTTTGVLALDKLISNYGFTVSYYSSTIKYAILTTKQAINAKPFCDSLQTFGGVLFVEPKPTMYGAGDEIIYSKVGNDQFYDFVVGYGDCQAGCIANHTFKFKVNKCSVDYLGVFDKTSPSYSIPDPINCEITSSVKITKIIPEQIKIYPNPAKNSIFIESIKNCKMEVFDLQGQLVMSIILSQNTSKVDITGLSKGVYFIKVTADEDVMVRKIMKE